MSRDIRPLCRELRHFLASHFLASHFLASQLPHIWDLTGSRPLHLVVLGGSTGMATASAEVDVDGFVP